ncbi:MAG TPA: VRR-NUC domain-containing protein [Steroidobacteraceae bacterium]|nr:VRR-NUC domain-containing protein [Steroidobacteraceae bacterium]
MQLILFPASLPVAADLYYLQHFRLAIEWLRCHYADLLSHPERAFIEGFPRLPRLSQALLVRMIMRTGPFFRATKLRYVEIGDITAALEPVAERGWVDLQPKLSIEELAALLRRAELAEVFPELPRRASKSDTTGLLRSRYHDRRTFEHWCPTLCDSVLFLSVAQLCTHLRLLFFGSFRQQWSQFVLVDLGVVQYETVQLSRPSRPFASREDIESFYDLYACARALEEQQPLANVAARLSQMRLHHDWLESRRARLLFEIGRRLEASGEHAAALPLYRQSRHPEARIRAVRVLERQGRLTSAYTAARRVLSRFPTELEVQRLPRALRRLERRLGLPCRTRTPLRHPMRLQLTLPALKPGDSIERAVCAQLARRSAPTFYVENTLITSLFGLLCWEAVFAPVRGAFFHAFQAGPRDLYSRSFVNRRRVTFLRCLASLESGAYRELIRYNLRSKHSLQSPFVAWGAISSELIELALACIPAPHLHLYFERLLADPGENRTGLPDLVQFWTDKAYYRLIEVKSPGDRLQDNQRRWMDYCLHHQLPVALCQVRCMPSETN